MNIRCKMCKVIIELNEEGYPEEKYLVCPKCQRFIPNPYWNQIENKTEYIG